MSPLNEFLTLSGKWEAKFNFARKYLNKMQSKVIFIVYNMQIFQFSRLLLAVFAILSLSSFFRFIEGISS